MQYPIDSANPVSTQGGLDTAGQMDQMTAGNTTTHFGTGAPAIEGAFPRPTPLDQNPNTNYSTQPGVLGQVTRMGHKAVDGLASGLASLGLGGAHQHQQNQQLSDVTSDQAVSTQEGAAHPVMGPIPPTTVDTASAPMNASLNTDPTGGPGVSEMSLASGISGAGGLPYNRQDAGLGDDTTLAGPTLTNLGPDTLDTTATPGLGAAGLAGASPDAPAPAYQPDFVNIGQSTNPPLAQEQPLMQDLGMGNAGAGALGPQDGGLNPADNTISGIDGPTTTDFERTAAGFGGDQTGIMNAGAPAPDYQPDFVNIGQSTNPPLAQEQPLVQNLGVGNAGVATGLDNFDRKDQGISSIPDQSNLPVSSQGQSWAPVGGPIMLSQLISPPVAQGDALVEQSNMDTAGLNQTTPDLVAADIGDRGVGTAMNPILGSNAAVDTPLGGTAPVDSAIVDPVGGPGPNNDLTGTTIAEPVRDVPAPAPEPIPAAAPAPAAQTTSDVNPSAGLGVDRALLGVFDSPLGGLFGGNKNKPAASGAPGMPNPTSLTTTGDAPLGQTVGLNVEKGLMGAFDKPLGGPAGNHAASQVAPNTLDSPAVHGANVNEQAPVVDNTSAVDVAPVTDISDNTPAMNTTTGVSGTPGLGQFTAVGAVTGAGAGLAVDDLANRNRTYDDGIAANSTLSPPVRQDDALLEGDRPNVMPETAQRGYGGIAGTPITASGFRTNPEYIKDVGEGDSNLNDDPFNDPVGKLSPSGGRIGNVADMPDTAQPGYGGISGVPITASGFRTHPEYLKDPANAGDETYGGNSTGMSLQQREGINEAQTTPGMGVGASPLPKTGPISDTTAADVAVADNDGVAGQKKPGVVAKIVDKVEKLLPGHKAEQGVDTQAQRASNETAVQAV
jgi:hypothetical protein